MTLQGLSKYLDKYDIAYSYNGSALESLKGLPFYNFQDSTDRKTFNHAIGLPRKEGVPCPLHDYEQMLYDTLQECKHVWIKKATGLGISEFILRYMAWLCLFSPIYAGTQMCIVTGPRIELAITLIVMFEHFHAHDFVNSVLVTIPVPLEDLLDRLRRLRVFVLLASL